MLFNLVKKDLLLAKKYLLILLVFSIAGPIFIEMKSFYISKGFLGLFLTALFTQYMLFNTISNLEDKSKGSALLCATPYTRNALVKAKYLLIFVIFVYNCAIYTVISFIMPSGILIRNISTVGISFLIITVYFGIFIPLQYRYGYEKTKYISLFLVFISPFVLSYIVKLLQSGNINFNIGLPFGSLLPYLLALVIGFVSMIVSIRIYSRKDL